MKYRDVCFSVVVAHYCPTGLPALEVHRRRYLARAVGETSIVIRGSPLWAGPCWRRADQVTAAARGRRVPPSAQSVASGHPVDGPEVPADTTASTKAGACYGRTGT